MFSSCPVPYFGQFKSARVGTLGINPSNREFLDAGGDELEGSDRRFPTLKSLGLSHWSDASSLDISAIVSACDDYFAGNPYGRWFGILERILVDTGTSFYSESSPAVHLDLVPYATDVKWGQLQSDQKQALLFSGSDLLAELLRDSVVELLILNGASVVREFEKICGLQLLRDAHQSWDLPRNAGSPVHGIGYTGEIDRIGNIELERSISIVGINHNLQSSYGVTRSAIEAIAEWIGLRWLRVKD
jgi:hypothetical protein